MSLMRRAPPLLITLLCIALPTSGLNFSKHIQNAFASLFSRRPKETMADPAQRLKDLKAPYPEPRPDQRRYVIFLEPKGDQEELDNYKVELMPGRVESVDGANHHRVGGNVEEKTIEGWGYNYYEVTMFATASTLMMPLGAAAELQPRFVRMYVDQLYRYNSKLPIVVYMPKNSELRYRIWTATGASEGVPAPEL
ncbi:ecotin putative (ISP2) [Leptomonas pyrrhocoris]|uniref:Ecotin putative (ISP2) n=1 Tax=Leptomonas pyrrhocoris TaxID=157538 RepID=A0A0M9FSR2_LEPPY|nr:ecotin putative (ISP2) [Leptomonas pyrrhocoris]XP_015653618.1 ecotin putative (ISP2) [Leptomonas pyrrhocoris]XP_015653619.1 ecotin putative (ISP2) [Leptomonas pyrrhocoris]KPA75178.1 ecotin putative (ISP2) [Leptomonas pyrrhocoris]KPA75179.1 ecotin putative (ISP2) [Leptomonas pyrrhocoris]KPA75180.1 ecotin putative (ISP2) [Leptomonas pyrrhocoris]|eukprot:XP_015653617.1 ecotin putative (ISP2) [Leptomonas pyrrhocoris]